MSPECAFFIYLIERYAAYKNTSADRILKLWDSLELTDLIYDLYDRYHCERLQNAFDDIDDLIGERQAQNPGADSPCNP